MANTTFQLQKIQAETILAQVHEKGGVEEKGAKGVATQVEAGRENAKKEDA